MREAGMAGWKSHEGAEVDDATLHAVVDPDASRRVVAAIGGGVVPGEQRYRRVVDPPAVRGRSVRRLPGAGAIVRVARLTMRDVVIEQIARITLNRLRADLLGRCGERIEQRRTQ